MYCLFAILLIATSGFSADIFQGIAIVKMKNATSAAIAESQLGDSLMVSDAIWPEEGIYKLVFDEEYNVSEIVDALRLDTDVELAQASYDVRFASVEPDDIEWPNQWNLYNESTRHDISAPEAWGISTGISRPLYGDTVVIGVLDTGYPIGLPADGVPLFHEIADNCWINWEEHVEEWPNTTDADFNGHVNDSYGVDAWNAAFGGLDGNPGNGQYWSHGTSVASIIGAVGNNGATGDGDGYIAGVMWDTHMMYLLFATEGHLDPTCCFHNWCETYVIQEWDEYHETSGQSGANTLVLNWSWYWPDFDCNEAPVDYWYLLQLNERGILVVCAAGDDDTNIDIESPVSPAGCDIDNVIAVASSGQDDAQGVYTDPNWGLRRTNVGGTSVDLAAPGVGVPAITPSRTPPWEVIGFNGTSAAAPQVTGCLGLMYSVPNPSFIEYYWSHPEAGANEAKDIMLDNVDPVAAWQGNSVSGGRLNMASSVIAMCNFYHDNGHEFESASLTATSPSANTNYVSGRGKHQIYVDGDDVFYAWTPGCGASQQIYKLTSDRWPGTEPTIASAQNQLNTDVYVSWIADPEGFTILQHKIGGDCIPTTTYSEEWRIAKLNEPAPSGQGVVNSCPVIAVEEGTIPVAFLASSGGASAGVHYWTAPSITWHDFEEWQHGTIPESEGDNITSVSAYTWENSDEIHVAWTTDDDEVYFVVGIWSGNQIIWDDAASVSDGLTGATDFSNVTYCFSPDLESGVCVWEVTQASTGRRNLYRAWGNDVNQGDNWTAPAAVFPAHDCWDRQSPQLHPYRDDGGSVSSGYSRIALAYEKNRWDIHRGAVEVTGLEVDEQSPRNVSLWAWIPPISRGIGKNPSLTEWSNGGYGLFYLADDGTAPYTFATETVPLTYDIAAPLPDPVVIASSVTIYPPVNLDRNIVIEDGGELIINQTNWCDDPTTVTFANRTGITVNSGGSLQIIGDGDSLITFESLDPLGKWAGIVVNGGSLYMDYAELKDCDSVCVYTNDPAQVSISNCVLRGNKMVTNAPVLRLWYGPSKAQYVSNTIVTDVPNGVGFYPWGSNLEFDNVTIEECDVVNSYIKSVTGNFRNCTFSGRASQYGVVFTGTGNTPNFQCCAIDNVSPLSGSYTSSIYAFSNSSPSFGYEGSTSGVSNEIKDSCAYLMRMTGSGVKPVVANQSTGAGGRNDWYQSMSGGKYFYWSSYPTPAVQYYAKGQYWDKGEDINKFYPASSSYYVITGSSTNPWTLCGGAVSSIVDRGPRSYEGLDDIESPYDSMFALAMSYEIERDFELSQPLFRTIALESDSYGLIWLAMTHAASNQRFLQAESEGTWIVPLIDSLVSVAPEELAYDSYVAAERLKGSYHLSLEDYEPAIDALADLLESGLTTMDSLCVSADLLNAYVVAGMVEYDGSLDNVNTSDRVPQALRVTSSEQAWSVEQGILSRIAQLESGGESPVTAALPTEFKLYQNYPNPFNPTTQIEFDLPEVSHLTLKVFNTLGQEVATVSDGKFNAGHFVMTWNGKSNAGIDVATGLYIYQLKAGSFLDTKKMILMR